VLRPNPPLSKLGLKFLLAIMVAMNGVIAAAFVLRGAWPVTPFMGADVGILAWALHRSSEAAKSREELSLTPSKLCVDYYAPGAKPRHVELNPYWVRVQLNEPVSSRNPIILASHDHRFAIGSFLPPHERLSFARALRSALVRVRTARAALQD